MRCDVRPAARSLARFYFFAPAFPGQNFAEIKIKNGGARGRRLLAVRSANFPAHIFCVRKARGIIAQVLSLTLARVLSMVQPIYRVCALSHISRFGGSLGASLLVP